MKSSATIPSSHKIQTSGVRTVQLQMGCTELEPMLTFFLETLQFRIEAIYPADNPTTAMISGYGCHIRLIKNISVGIEALYLLCDDPVASGAGHTQFTAPNGVRVQLVMADPPMRQPITRQALVVSRAADVDHWAKGRAGMRYRDLLPDRLGGAFIASQIRILEGGLVPDYVHYHKVRFQFIYCRKGWVRVAYEGQGESIVMKPGDCVLQPPMIRHRVIESSAQAEVIEIGTPAEHITMADHTMQLPNTVLEPGRDFDGQQFIFHRAEEAAWTAWRAEEFEMRDTGIGLATAGLADVRLVRPLACGATAMQALSTEFCFYFVISGQVTVSLGERHEILHVDDSISIPTGMPYVFRDSSKDLALLEVTLPAIPIP